MVHKVLAHSKRPEWGGRVTQDIRECAPCAQYLRSDRGFSGTSNYVIADQPE